MRKPAEALRKFPHAEACGSPAEALRKPCGSMRKPTEVMRKSCGSHAEDLVAHTFFGGNFFFPKPLRKVVYCLSPKTVAKNLPKNELLMSQK